MPRRRGKAPRPGRSGTPKRRRAARAPRRPARIVVVGGSAGGLDSLKALLRRLPADFPAPILAVLHLDPRRPSQAAELLAGHSRLPVAQARAGESLRAGHVYLAPPDRHLEVRGRRIVLSRTAPVNFSRPSVDQLFISVARTHGRRAVAVVLSGTGQDGRQGAKAIRMAGGICIVEDPATAEHAGMPKAAAAADGADAVVPGRRLGYFLQHLLAAPRPRTTLQAWEAAARILLRQCDADFSGYRQETMRRRMESRMAATGTTTGAKYVQLLRRDAAERERLRSALLVKVSSFLRDPAAWVALERHVLVPLARIAARREVRMWSAGCATGEEAYSLALMTAAAANGRGAIKVFGTDLDEAALATARAGRYPPEALADMPRRLAARYFAGDGDARRVRADLRRHVVFGRHDLLRDPPLAGMDLVACRNVLIYLQPADRREVLRRLTDSVRPGGILFLGKAEGAATPGPGFERVAKGLPIFRRVAMTRARARGAAAAKGARKPPTHGPPRPVEPVAFAIDPNLVVTVWSRAAESVFGVTSEEAIGTPVDALLPPHAVGRAALKAALASRRPTRLPPIVVAASASERRLTLRGIPLPKGAGLMLIGTLEPPVGGKGQQVRRASVGRRAAALEMQEDMETQQTLNEELQSRNEELETVNEELQSLNDEIQVQGDEARRATLFLTAMLDSGPDVVIGCDTSGRVSYWGAPAVRMFRLSAAQALGKDLLGLVPELDVPGLRKLVRPGARWPRTRGGARVARRVVKVSSKLRVAVVPARDVDGDAHGTLLRVLPPRPAAPRGPARRQARSAGRVGR